MGWQKGVRYFHPPVGLVWKVIRKAEREKVEGVLIVPDWPGSVLLAVLENRVKKGNILLMEKWRPRMNCPRKNESNTFRGVLKFNMCVYHFNF